jgi:hypothetical protein
MGKTINHKSEIDSNQISVSKLNKYIELKREAEKLYSNFGSVICPYFGNSQRIIFDSEGFNHIIYRIKKQERDRRAQIMRFELLKKAKLLLETTNTVQEFEEYYKNVTIRIKKRNEQKNVLVKDWGFVAIISEYRIKVVLRQTGSGGIKFHSIIPAWSTNYYRDIKMIRNTKGNVADD